MVESHFSLKVKAVESVATEIYINQPNGVVTKPEAIRKSIDAAYGNEPLEVRKDLFSVVNEEFL